MEVFEFDLSRKTTMVFWPTTREFRKLFNFAFFLALEGPDPTHTMHTHARAGFPRKLRIEGKCATLDPCTCVFGASENA